MKFELRIRTPREIGELIAKIIILLFFIGGYCLMSTLDFNLLYGG